LKSAPFAWMNSNRKLDSNGMWLRSKSEAGMMQDEKSAEIVIPAIEGVTPPSATNSALTAFYADRKRMWSNVFWITFGQFGMSVSMTIVEPLMNLRLKATTAQAD